MGIISNGHAINAGVTAGAVKRANKMATATDEWQQRHAAYQDQVAYDTLMAQLETKRLLAVLIDKVASRGSSLEG